MIHKINGCMDDKFTACGSVLQDVHAFRRMEMVERTVSVSDAHILSGQDALMDILFGFLHGLRQRMTECQIGGNGRRQGTAGAVGVAAFHLPGGEEMGVRLAPELEDITHSSFGQVSAFDQYGLAGIALQQLNGCRLHAFYVRYRITQQHLGLAQVGRNQGSQGHEPGSDGSDGLVFHQLASAGRHHHGVEDHKFGSIPLQAVGDDLHDAGIVYHADFHSPRTDIGHDGLNLALYVFGRNRMNARNSARILYGNGCNGTGSIGPQGRNGLDIGLNTSSSAAVGTGNCQYTRVMFHGR